MSGKNPQAHASPILDKGYSLYGHLPDTDFSVEYHLFNSPVDVEWTLKVVESEVMEIYLNAQGTGELQMSQKNIPLDPRTIGGWALGEKISMFRPLGELHEFISLKVSRSFLTQVFSGKEHRLRSSIKNFLWEKKMSLAVPFFIQREDFPQSLFSQLRHPPVSSSARGIWYHAKLLELIAELFFETQGEEMFCHRQERLARDRVEKAQQLLLDDLSETLSLEELGKQVGCSSSYLSRTFSKQMGMTIPQFLRNARIAKAAELLRSGKYNVTETALEVGYSSLSHFSKVFYEITGCCPGLYPNEKLFPKKLKVTTSNESEFIAH